MKSFMIDEQLLKTLEQIKSRLFTENRMNGDEMRDAAQAIDYIIRIVRELEIPEVSGPKTLEPMKPGIAELRHMVKNFNECNESFLDGEHRSFTIEQLVTLHRAWMASGWDIYPDRWEPRQVEEALRGIPPKWDSKTEKPVYDEVTGPNA